MNYEEFAEVAAEASHLDLGAVDSDALQEPLQQANFTAQARVQALVYVVRVERCPVRGAQPLAVFSAVAWHDVYSEAFHERLKVRVLREPLHLSPAFGGFSGDFQADGAESFPWNRRRQTHEHVNIWLLSEPGVFRH